MAEAASADLRPRATPERPLCVTIRPASPSQGPYSWLAQESPSRRRRVDSALDARCSPPCHRTHQAELGASHYADAIGCGTAAALDRLSVHDRRLRDRKGDWVDEATDASPGLRAQPRRLAAEAGLGRLADTTRGGYISPCGHLRAGPFSARRSARRDGAACRKPGHAFGAFIATTSCPQCRRDAQVGRPVPRVLHLADDEPPESADVIAEAAPILGSRRAGTTQFEVGHDPTMSPMARASGRSIARSPAARPRQILGLRWHYPSYREGLRRHPAPRSDGKGLA